MFLIDTFYVLAFDQDVLCDIVFEMPRSMAYWNS